MLRYQNTRWPDGCRMMMQKLGQPVCSILVSTCRHCTARAAAYLRLPCAQACLKGGKRALLSSTTHLHRTCTQPPLFVMHACIHAGRASRLAVATYSPTARLAQPPPQQQPPALPAASSLRHAAVVHPCMHARKRHDGQHHVIVGPQAPWQAPQLRADQRPARSSGRRPALSR